MTRLNRTILVVVLTAVQGTGFARTEQPPGAERAQCGGLLRG